MELGLQIDGVDRRTFRQSMWAPGPPESRDETFLGMQVFEDWVLKLDKGELKPIRTYRCRKCGFLENYAR